MQVQIQVREMLPLQRTQGNNEMKLAALIQEVTSKTKTTDTRS
jgi:hypothetical protein